MFKNLIGRGHPEFSGKQQQDAQVSLKSTKTRLPTNSCPEIEFSRRVDIWNL